MIEIKVVTDFSFAPGARDYDDGKDSGQEFYETLLKIKFKEALDKNLKLKIEQYYEIQKTYKR